MVKTIQKMHEKFDTDIDKQLEILSQIYALSNEFYYLIPQSGYACEKIKPIDEMVRGDAKQ